MSSARLHQVRSEAQDEKHRIHSEVKTPETWNDMKRVSRSGANRRVSTRSEMEGIFTATYKWSLETRVSETFFILFFFWFSPMPTWAFRLKAVESSVEALFPLSVTHSSQKGDFFYTRWDLPTLYCSQLSLLILYIYIYRKSHRGPVPDVCVNFPFSI